MLSGLFRRRDTPVFRAAVQPAGVRFTVRGRQRLLDAALDQGLDFPHSCRVGGCGTCRCRLVAGKVKEHTDSSYLLSAEEIARGFILACQSSPESDVTLEVSGLRLDSSLPPTVRCDATLVAKEWPTHDILRATVELDEPVGYLAGQYADLTAPGIGARSYSFSCAPSRRASDRHAQFDIRVLPGGAFSGWIDQHAQLGERLVFEGPRGSFHLRSSGAPIVAVAGGTGLGPILALSQELQSAAVTRDLTVLVGARTEADLYGLDELEALQKRFSARLDVWPVLSADPNSHWQGRRGMVTEHLRALPRLSEHHAYLCGPPPMVDAALQILEEAGCSNVFFDKFLDGSQPQ